ncbi:hypothetical protein LYNGBM3L_74880 [Moorena producens 3L]|uniref:Uncharacterized protein n=1 Tax=Moorena producens 3L TaxID=489825 RepID=F4Y487_9CYAN|nr:hypothetical protein LYNGBM3L_74880 [Moorena producens 3L]
MGRGKKICVPHEDKKRYPLNQQKEIDVILNQDIIKSRYEISSYYDPFVKHLSQLKYNQNSLNIIPTFINQYGR